MPHDPTIGAGLLAGLVRKGGENALTELLAELLRVPIVGQAFLQDVVELSLDEGAIDVETQVRGSGCRPDLVLTTSGATIWVEAKLDAGLTARQPVGYVEALARLRSGSGHLVFLVKAARWRELSGAIRGRLGLPVGLARRWAHRDVSVTLVTWRHVRDRFEALSVGDPVAHYLMGEFLSTLDHHERAVMPLKPEAISMLHDPGVLAAFAGLEDLLIDLKERLESDGHKIEDQEKGHLNQHGFYVLPLGALGRAVWVGILLRAGVKWPGRGPLWAWLCDEAYGRGRRQEIEQLGFEVLDPTRILTDWEEYALVPLRVTGATSMEQIENLIMQLEQIWGRQALGPRR